MGGVAGRGWSRTVLGTPHGSPSGSVGNHARVGRCPLPPRGRVTMPELTNPCGRVLVPVLRWPGAEGATAPEPLRQQDHRGEATLEHRSRSAVTVGAGPTRSEEHTSELQSLMRISYAVFCLKKKTARKEKREHKTKDKTEKHSELRQKKEDKTT